MAPRIETNLMSLSDIYTKYLRVQFLLNVHLSTLGTGFGGEGPAHTSDKRERDTRGYRIGV